MAVGTHHVLNVNLRTPQAFDFLQCIAALKTQKMSNNRYQQVQV